MRPIWDDVVKGLHLRERPSGRKSYFYFYRSKDGKQRKPKLGDTPPLTLADARKMAKEIMMKVNVGKDPSKEWSDAAREWTVEQLFCSTWNIHWDKERFHNSGRAYDVKLSWNKYLLPTFGAMKISEVTAAKVREWLRGYEDKPIAGNRALEVLSRMYRHAEEMEIRPQHTNPCHLVKAFTERKRKRFASVEEIAKIGAILKRDYNEYPREVSFILILMLTGARPKSIECSTWNNLKTVGDVGVLTFHGKTSEASGEDEVVVFPPTAMKILDALPKEDTLLGIKSPNPYWNKVRKEAGCPDLWLRDLRRTFATTGMGEGESVGVIGELLNHKSAQTTAIYAKLSGTKRFETAMNIATKMAGLLQLKAI